MKSGRMFLEMTTEAVEQPTQETKPVDNGAPEEDSGTESESENSAEEHDPEAQASQSQVTPFTLGE